MCCWTICECVYPLAEAKAQMAKLDANAKQLDLGKRVISRYGCYSCHQINGFEGVQPIGTELSEEGSKLVHPPGLRVRADPAQQARVVPSEAPRPAIV